MRQAYKFCFVYDKQELNFLESEFLAAIDYKLMVDQDEIDRYFSLVTDRAQVLQCKKFKVHTENYIIIEDYFKKPEKLPEPSSTYTKLPPVFLNGKLFKDSEEVYHFFDCEDI